ncbi:type I addiction module toxin, SymE family [Proteus mirabilis]|nr:type I addiction module toxin, SymE family [Proteus mirabilis]MBG2767218.1 type I addiction module toxin, SymE family [Proteus mirabilis]
MGYLPNNSKSNPSPQLAISGKWLNELGFEISSPLSQTVDYLVG